MFGDIRNWYGMAYSPYIMGSGSHPYVMSSYHYPHHHHHHPHHPHHHYHHPHHDNVTQSQAVMISMPHMMPHVMHGMN
ncbi:hypothetical protein [Bacillus sp. JJ1562]|uniref:hypothetical protein n=1 Tax=Bacillus sp. JJ1562 TaxID=3122960 RepID=UPI0030038D30